MKLLGGHSFEVITEDLAFPEGPVWIEDGSVIVVEVAGGRITRVLPDGRHELVADCGGGPGGAALGPDGALYVCNNGGMQAKFEAGRWKTMGEAGPGYHGGWIDRIDLTNGSIDRLYESADGIPLAGPNDIVFDSNGGFWFTDFGKPMGESIRKGAILYATPDGKSIHRVVTGPRFNGIALSPDETTLYGVITHESLVVEFDITTPGTLHPDSLPRGRTVAQFPARHVLDSMAVEAGGRLCVATTFAQPGIGVVDPITGGIGLVEIEDPSPTNICFGGHDMQDAWITLSGKGKLVKTRWQRPGLALANMC